MKSNGRKVQNRTRFYCNAIIIGLLSLTAACASTSGAEWAAHGYLSPGPTSEPEIIGVYDKKSACEDAAEAWMSRQVVGNAIFAECYPVDRR